MDPAKDVVDPEEKVRTVPHIQGNWATLVYIPVESPSLSEWISKALERLQSCQSGLIELKDDLETEFHISLSRTVYLKVYQIDRFVEKLSVELSGNRTCKKGELMLCREIQCFFFQTDSLLE